VIVRILIGLASVVAIAAAVETRAPSGATVSIARPLRPLPSSADEEACSTCHPAQWSEWEGSRHAAAWRDPIFQSEFARGRPAWCVGCHAPLALDRTAPSETDVRVTSGVACGACHDRDGQMVSSRRAPTSPHATVVDREFGSPAFCASCHQFNFPILGERGRLVHYTSEPMQATVDEWRASGVAADCVDCHADSPGRHAFRGSHDPERVASALSISVCRSGTALDVVLANIGAGHNVPSGGVHRRMVVRAWRSNAPERLVEYTLGRRFRPLSGGGKETIADTTIAAGATRTARFALTALGAGDPVVNVELRYIYALDEHVQLPTDVSNQIWFGRVDPRELPACER
jgi:hypothetical protein